MGLLYQFRVWVLATILDTKLFQIRFLRFIIYVSLLLSIILKQGQQQKNKDSRKFCIPARDSLQHSWLKLMNPFNHTSRREASAFSLRELRITFRMLTSTGKMSKKLSTKVFLKYGWAKRVKISFVSRFRLRFARPFYSRNSSGQYISHFYQMR